MKSSVSIFFVCAVLAPLSYQEDLRPEVIVDTVDQNRDCFVALGEFNYMDKSEKILNLERLNASQPDLVEHLMKLKDDRFQMEGNEYRSLKSDMFQKVGNSLYYVEDEKMEDWYTARSLCWFLGGHLASLQSDEQFVALSNHLRNVVNKTMQFSRFWLNTNDICQEGHYMPLKYAYWEANQPDNFDNIENCVELRRKFERFVMNDMPCVYEKYFICERNVESTSAAIGGLQNVG